MNMENVISLELLMLKSISGVKSDVLLRVYVDGDKLITRYEKSTFKESWIVKRINRGDAVVKKVRLYA